MPSLKIHLQNWKAYTKLIGNKLHGDRRVEQFRKVSETTSKTYMNKGLLLFISLIIFYLIGIIYFSNSSNLNTFSAFSVTIINIFVASALFYAAIHSKRDNQRHFFAWMMIGVSITLVAIGSFLYGILQLFYGVYTTPSSADIFYSLFFPFLAIGIILMTNLKKTTTEYYKFYKNIIDALIIVITLTIIIWVSIVIPIIEINQSSFLIIALNLSYIFMGLFLLFILLNFIFNLSNKKNIFPYMLLSLGIGIALFSDFGFFFYNLQGNSGLGIIMNLLFVISYVIMGIAALTQVSSYNGEKSLNKIRLIFKSELLNYIPFLAIIFIYLAIIISYFYLNSNIYFLTLGLGLIIVLAFIRQFITFQEEKKVKEILQKSLKEKEILLKEVHHRVKNNMQIISSLLNLQQYSIKDPDSLEAFRETKNRVNVMAMVHEEIYKSKDLGSIEVGDYIENLLKSLYRTYINDTELVKLEMDVEPINIGIDNAIPLGIIINELITNSLKYAFPEGKKGKVNLSLFSKNEDYILIESDNGIGIPDDIDFKNADTLGLQLVNTLVSQINGNIDLNRNNGTEFIIKFRNKPKKAKRNINS